MSAREELKEMARGFRWGRRPLVPRSAEPHALGHEERTFPTDWARTDAGVAARQVLLNGVMRNILRAELSLSVHGRENLEGVGMPVIFFSNHTSHLDATIIMTSLPDEWLRRAEATAP